MKIRFTFLGTGTSQGIPVIGCRCKVCTSTDIKDQRLRTAALVSIGDINIAIDTGPDFRMQMLRAGVETLEAVLITHEHNDHIAGLDDVRPFNFSQGKDMPVYTLPRVAAALRSRFQYIFDDNPYPGAPQIALYPIEAGTLLHIGEIPVLPLAVQHGEMPILGFRIGGLAYITDAKYLSKATIESIQEVPVLILNALHHRSHHSHMDLQEALQAITLIRPGKVFLTHISHHMGLHEEVNRTLPEGVSLAYDGLKLEC